MSMPGRRMPAAECAELIDPCARIVEDGPYHPAFQLAGRQSGKGMHDALGHGANADDGIAHAGTARAQAARGCNRCNRRPARHVCHRVMATLSEEPHLSPYSLMLPDCQRVAHRVAHKDIHRIVRGNGKGKKKPNRPETRIRANGDALCGCFPAETGLLNIWWSSVMLAAT